MEYSLNVQRMSEVFSQAEAESDSNWVVDGLLLAGGTSILSAQPKVGKSTMTRQLAASVAHGWEFLGRHTTPGKVLVCAFEDHSRREIANHFDQLGVEPDCDNIYLHMELPKGNTMQTFREIRKIARAGKFKLIIIDTLNKMLGGGTDLQNYRIIDTAMKPFAKLAQTTGAHVMIVHHAKKGKARTAVDAAIGSTAITGAVDTVLGYTVENGKRILRTEQRYGYNIEEMEIIVDEGQVVPKPEVEPPEVVKVGVKTGGPLLSWLLVFLSSILLISVGSPREKPYKSKKGGRRRR